MLAMFVVRSPRNIYSYVKQILEDGNKVEYLTSLPREILARNITHHWSSAGSFIDSKQLSIRSSTDYFPKEELHKIGTLKATESLKPGKSKDSIVILCPAAVATYLRTVRHKSDKQFGTMVSKVNRIIEFETAVSKRFLDNVIVCCLFERFFRGLDTVPLLLLMKYHKIAIASNNVISVSQDEILDAIKRGIDSTMGERTSLLIFKTLLHIYKIDESFALRNPELWYSKLEKLLGTHNHDQIQRAIANEVGKLIVQDTAHDSDQAGVR